MPDSSSSSGSTPGPSPAAATTRSRADWAFVIAAVGCQLASAYYDMIRGPLMPSIAAALRLDFVESGWFVAVSSIVSTISTYLLIGALNRWSERTVMATVSAVGVLAGLAAPLVGSFPALLLLSASAGIAFSTVGTMANVLIVEGAPAHLKGRFVSGLHSMYGFGSMCATGVVGWALARGAPWSSLYSAAVPLYLALVVFALVKLRRHAGGAPRAVQSAKLSKLQVLIVVTFAVYAAAEVTTSLWLTSYLVAVHGMPASTATPYLTRLFLIFTLARVGCAVWLKPQYEKPLLYAALSLPLVAFAVGYAGYPEAFMLMGLYGPFFPVLLTRVSRLNPAKWRSMTIWVMLGVQVSVGISNVSLGRLADLSGLRVAFCVPPALLVANLILLSLCLYGERRPAL